MGNNLTSTEVQQAIFQAIRDNDLTEVQSLFYSCDIQPKNITDKTDKNNTLLHCAVEENRYEIVQELLLKTWEININAQNDDGDTALHLCAKNNYDRLIHLLLKNGAVSDVVNKEGLTFLNILRRLVIRTGIYRSNQQVEIMHQVVTGQSEEQKITKVDPMHTKDNKKRRVSPQILDRNAKINKIANKNWSLLHIAAYNGEIARVRYLLGLGAKIDAESKDKLTPLHCATKMDFKM
ncbi:ankyrin-1-like [Ctenocephalides felis]|uniref:ankyrin-1-like n=1 Tax=Ctenocephalides felis TaxID=7515 RepID=UPI000E6E54F6|nr:ankyrin-1-like [Ctenocephalides felis]